jgi:alanine racemase
MPRPIRATIHRLALQNNLSIARRCNPAARLLAVIKADAYGHGVLRVADALHSADGFAVLELDAAVRLRAAGIQARIVLLEGFFDPSDLVVCSEHRLTAVVHAIEQLSMLEGVVLPRPVDVFLKINTGMNRLGVEPSQFNEVLRRLQACRNVTSVVLMTHYACADDDTGVQWQLDRFNEISRGLDLPVSMANSATLLRYPELARDWARPGIMLYGASPFARISAAELGLKPAMTLETRIIATQTLQANDRVGYGASFVAPIPMRIGVTACGYADGYPRHAATGTAVLVDGSRTRLVGRVSMDMLCVDITDLPQAAVGSRVVLWGEGLPVDEVASAAGTISYELLCALAPRVPVVESD